MPDPIRPMPPAAPLQSQAEDLLRRPAGERLERLLDAPQPMRLVRSLPDAEIYLIVREVGPADSLPLLALASADQLQHLFDLEAWRGDRFDGDRAGAWVALFLEAGEPTLHRFLRKADDETLALLFARWIRVQQIETDDAPSQHGHGETEAGTEDGFLSPDGYHRFSPPIAAHEVAVRRIAEALFVDQRERYERAVWAAQWELPAELEEGGLRWRQSRLDERGYPDPETALEVYAPPVGNRAHPDPPPVETPDALVAPRTALRALEPGHALVLGLERLTGGCLDRVLFELTAVANKILVADRADTGDLAAHRAAMVRASAYVGIALESRGAPGSADAARILDEVPAVELFREGFARVAELQTRARRFLRDGWPSHHPRAMEALDPPVRPTVGALVERRPLFHDPRTGVRGENRDFRSRDEIEHARILLDLAEALGRTVDAPLGWGFLRSLAELPATAAPPKLRRLFLTSLAAHAESARLAAGPVTPESADRFLARASSHEAGGEMLEAFLQAIRRTTDPGERQVSALRAYGRAILADVPACGRDSLLVKASS